VLKSLYIKNYVLIEELTFAPENGLNIITGETGAGKSILVGALGLVLGNRADTKAVRAGEKKCVVEACFVLETNRLERFFRENDLDYDEELILRREIQASGKSRSFINDSPASLQLLNELSFHLVDIHSQHEHLLLKNQSFLFSWLDSMSNSAKEAEAFKQDYLSYRELQTKLKKLQEAQRSSTAELDFWQFQWEELSSVELEVLDFKDLEEEYDTLSNAEELQSLSYQAYENLAEAEGSALERIRTTIKEIGALASTKSWKELMESLSNIDQELSDAALELRRQAESIEPDDMRLKELDDLISQLNRLMQKHGCMDLEGLIQKKNDLHEWITNHEKQNDSFAELEKELQELKKKLVKIGEVLHRKRESSSEKLEKGVAQELVKLGLPNAEVRIDLSLRTEWNAFGQTNFKLLFSPNKGMPLAEASKSASGGEISRLMLVLKAQLAKHVGMPTLIFDEIDTGVSGEIGQKMGQILQEMARQKQVICITHLPQIAAAGEHHYFVYKTEDRETTSSGIRKLSEEERVLEIAKMLSGDQPTDGAIHNAKELLAASFQNI
jgi:DNA repair protein RecN (Recombination protein N)